MSAPPLFPVSGRPAYVVAAGRKSGITELVEWVAEVKLRPGYSSAETKSRLVPSPTLGQGGGYVIVETGVPTAIRLREPRMRPLPVQNVTHPLFGTSRLDQGQGHPPSWPLPSKRAHLSAGPGMTSQA